MAERMEVHSPALQIGPIPCYLTPSSGFDELGRNATYTMEPDGPYLTRLSILWAKISGWR